jgi:hypothetical protein
MCGAILPRLPPSGNAIAISNNNKNNYTYIFYVRLHVVDGADFTAQRTAVCPYQRNVLGVRPPRICLFGFLQPQGPGGKEITPLWSTCNSINDNEAMCLLGDPHLPRCSHGQRLAST